MTARFFGAGICAFAMTAGIAVYANQAAAEEFPSKTIEVITHAGAGGGTDVTARMMMIRGRKELGADLVVVNKRGGGGALSMNYFMGRPNDGHSILTFTNGHALTIAKGKSKLKFEDMRPIARGTFDPQILMASCKAGKFKTAEDLVAAMKEEQLKFGIAGVGTVDHVTAFVFAKKAGVKQPTVIAFKGGGEVATQLVAGAVDIGTLNLAEAESQIANGDICPLVVLADERMKPIPDVKTAKEIGVDAVFAMVRGFVTHASVDDERAKKLEMELVEAMNHGVYQSFLESSGLDGTSVVGADEWGAQIKTMAAEMGPALKEMGLIK